MNDEFIVGLVLSIVTGFVMYGLLSQKRLVFEKVNPSMKKEFSIFIAMGFAAILSMTHYSGRGHGVTFLEIVISSIRIFWGFFVLPGYLVFIFLPRKGPVESRLWKAVVGVLIFFILLGTAIVGILRA